jgi:hypothetical protein
MHLHSFIPIFHNRTRSNFAQNGFGQHAVGTSLKPCFRQVSLSFQSHYFVLRCIKMLQEIGEYWSAWHIHNLSVDHECWNVWTTMLQCIICTYFQRQQFGKYGCDTTTIPIKMSQITNPVFSNHNQLPAMRGKDGWSDTWLQRSAYLTQLYIQLWRLKKGKEDYILIFQYEQVNVFYK